MNFYILTLFPEMFMHILDESILKRAKSSNLISIRAIDIRNFAKDKHKTVDDKPYGGGVGMVLKVDVAARALESITKSKKTKPYVILLSASGKKYDQKSARKLAKKKDLIIISGHYEGIDARIEDYADEIISIGDFILTGGEIPALAIIDSITRLIPGTINPKSPLDESFQKRLLEYPQYTRPEKFRGVSVPEVLLSGNHQEIEKWRREQSLKRTKIYRPDLLK